MATQEPSQGGLPNIGVDLTKAPLYGAGTDEYMDTIQKAQQDAIKALQDRYANPNWFKVAAGFAKPQLGGFLASLGSASEAMGDTVEQERAQQMPIQVLKMQAAQTGALMKTTKDVNDEIRKWTAAHPNEQVPSDLLRDWISRAQDSQGVKGILKEREDFQAKMRLSQEQQQQDKDLLEARRKAGAITSEEYIAGLNKINNRNKFRPSGDTNALPTPPPDASGKQATDEVKPPPLPPTAAEPRPDASDKPKQAYKPTYFLPHKQAVTADEVAANESAKATAASVNAEPESQYKALQKINDPSAFPLAMAANKSIQNAIKSDPKAFIEVTNMVRQQGGIANMLNKGLQMHFNGYGITVGVPVGAVAEGNLDSDKQAYRDTLLSNLATAAYYNLLARNQDPSKQGEGKFAQSIAQEMGIDNAPKAIDHQTELNIEQLKHSKRLYKAMTNGLPEALKAGSLSAHYDVQNQSDEVAVESEMYQRILDQKSKEYHERLKRKKP